ncbi:MAG: polysaccharide biosynthesis protein [Flavobacteriales bacterium]|nr:polysaccharide biosynthesis protein [Flavobacteriales bacterium]
MPLNYIRKLTSKHMPRWVVLNIDMMVSVFSFSTAYFLIQNVRHAELSLRGLIVPLVLVVTFRLIGILFSRSYKGIIKYTSSQDAIRIFFAVTGSTAAVVVIQQLVLFLTGTKIVPLSVLVVDYTICLALLTSLRLGYKLLYRSLSRSRFQLKHNALIYGAGHTGMITKRSIDADVNSDLKVVAFMDDDPKLSNKTAEGLPIYMTSRRFHYLIKKYDVKELIIAIHDLSPQKKRKVIEMGLQYNLSIKNVPPIESWINGQFTTNQIRNVNIEDLLGREPINLENRNIEASIKGKCILVTGAAGSIGSEIVHQCLSYQPSKLILLDQGETPLYELEYSLDRSSATTVELVIADVSNKGRMEKVFKMFEPEIVFHAAAYKHVPLMEENPYEAISTNVFGTRNVADLSVQYGVEKFVFVSTDKAVNPTNIMGASKRMAEIYVQSLNNFLSIKDDNHTKFITTRFGNVLGSNGSVIPRFQEQIEKGGPVTVTHPEITRYFMTIPEACQLVLEAGAMGQGGEIFIFDMGESVRIVDLAKKMIQLSGYQIGRDIEIEFTGLRPGEKLTEELLNKEENTIGTHHPKIMVAKVREYDFNEITDSIQTLYDVRDRITNKLIVTTMKQMVPEFVSNNSRYEELDRKASPARA